MKRFNFHEIVFLFLSIGLLTIMLFGMSGCSANYHLNKFQNKGGVCGKIDTIRVTKYDTITNTYYHFDSLVVVNDRVVPLTRTEIRYMDRVRHDTLNHKETIIKYLTKAEIKKEKAERKTKTAPWKIGIVILALIALIVFLLKFR
jgi:hypothetical protein